MCLCACVSDCVYVYVCACFPSSQVYVPLYLYAPVRVLACMFMHVRACVCDCLCACIYMCVFLLLTRICVCTCACTSVYVQSHGPCLRQRLEKDVFSSLPLLHSPFFFLSFSLFHSFVPFALPLITSPPLSLGLVRPERLGGSAYLRPVGSQECGRFESEPPRLCWRTCYDGTPRRLGTPLPYGRARPSRSLRSHFIYFCEL